MQKLVALLCLSCCLATASASYAEAFLGLTPYTATLERDPQCIQTFIACRAACRELELKVQHHRPVQDVELFQRTTFYILLCFIAATVVSAGCAVSYKTQLQATIARHAAREAELLQRCQGIQAQAYDYAVKLGSQSNTPTAGMPNDSSPPAPTAVQLNSPVSCAEQTYQSTSTGYHSFGAAMPTRHQTLAAEASIPNLAALVAGAPAKDTVNNADDQLTGSPAKHQPATVAAQKSPAKQDQASVLPAPPSSPGQAPLFVPQLAANVNKSGHLSSPSGRYSPQSVGNASACSMQARPGGPVLVPRLAGSPTPSSTSPPPCYIPPSNSGSKQQAGRPGAVQWTPAQQQQDNQQQALSCPPMGALPHPGMPSAAPHSAGQLGASAPNLAGQTRREEANMLATPQGAGLNAWVNTSRGSGTPPPFGLSNLSQHSYASPAAVCMTSPASQGLYTPATASTARTGSMTHVQSLHSIAGSCGGSVPPMSATPGTSTPKSASSTTSGARGSSTGSRLAMDHAVTGSLLARLDNLKAATAERKKRAQEKLADMERQHAQQQGMSPSSSAGLRQSIV